MSLNIKDLFLLKKLIPYTYIKIDTTKTLEEYQKQTIDLINQLQLQINSKKISINNVESLPISTILLFAGTSIPINWLICDGSTLLISDYQELFNLIGNIYGGDGIKTFMIPDFRGKIPLGVSNNIYTLGLNGGEEKHTLTIDELPQHLHTGTTINAGQHNHNNLTGTVPDHIHTSNSTSYGLIRKSDGGNNTASNLNLNKNINLPDIITEPLNLDIYPAGSHSHTINNDGDHSHTFTTDNTGSNVGHNIMQPYLVINYLIKYI
jgi:microcystin-dependent protein